MSTDEQYEGWSGRCNGWSNRETWAVALHINDDQGWQESVHEALREYLAAAESVEERDPFALREGAADIIRESVEQVLDTVSDADGWIDSGYGATVAAIARDIGSLWRVDWTELGASFLESLKEDES